MFGIGKAHRVIKKAFDPQDRSLELHEFLAGIIIVWYLLVASFQVWALFVESKVEAFSLQQAGIGLGTVLAAVVAAGLIKRNGSDPTDDQVLNNLAKGSSTIQPAYTPSIVTNIAKPVVTQVRPSAVHPNPIHEAKSSGNFMPPDPE